MKNGDAIREALEAIRQANGGVLRPRDVVEAAKDEASPLHDRFQWNIEKAAYSYWLEQARDLITVYVEIEPRDNRPVQVYVSLRDDRREPGGGYRLIGDVLADPEARAKLLREALDDLARVERKYGRLSELAEVFEAAGRVVV